MLLTPEQIRENSRQYNKNWRDKNPKRNKKKNKQWREKNIKHVQDYNQDYRERNRLQLQLRAELVRARRRVIRILITGKCVICGYNKKPNRLHMHHTHIKNYDISSLVSSLSFVPTLEALERLVSELSLTAPCCSSCHRRLHTATVQLPEDFNLTRPRFRTSDIIQGMKDSGVSFGELTT